MKGLNIFGIEIFLKEIVQRCYLDYLNREADEMGLKHYVNLMKTNQIDEEKLIDIFKNSPEYKLSHPIELESDVSVDIKNEKKNGMNVQK